MKSTKDEPGGYKYGIIYSQKDDKRLFVPKGQGGGFGWTLNFANRWAYVIMALIIVVFVGGVATCIYISAHSK
jgi:uncharacterized membrane protein